MSHFPTEPRGRGRSCRRIAWIAIAVALVAALLAAVVFFGQPLYGFFSDPDRVSAFVRRWGRWAPLVTIALHVAQVLFAPIPGQALDAVNGYLFGPWLGTLYSMIGLGTGSTLAMALGRRFGRPLVERFVDEQVLARLDGVLDRQGAFLIFLIFLFPFLPDDAVCFLAGLTSLPLLELVLLALVGRTPGVFVANWLGAHAAALTPLGWGLLAAFLLAVAVLAWRFREPVQERLLAWIERLSSWLKHPRR